MDSTTSTIATSTIAASSAGALAWGWKLVWVMLGGALGTAARFGLIELSSKLVVTKVPLGTALVNILGCFAFGVVIAIGESEWQLHPVTRLLLLTGFLGAFTTFSTFAYDVSGHLRQGDLLWTGLTLLVHNAIGLMALFVGLWIGLKIAGPATGGV